MNSDIDYPGYDELSDKKNYINSLIFTNNKIDSIVDEILSNSYEPPIIILQSDHGPESTFHHNPNYGWNNPNNIMLKERMSILK